MRITFCAQRLAVEQGYDNFTLDELAEQAGVSRRTLFNYFPGKLDAVLGAQPGLPDEAVETFIAGGPRGDLVGDLGELVCALLTVWGPLTREQWATMRDCLITNPRLFNAAIERFDGIARTMTGLVEQRSGLPHDQACVALGLIKGLFEGAIERFVEHHDERPLDTIFRDHLQVARTPHTRNSWRPCSTNSATRRTASGISS